MEIYHVRINHIRRPLGFCMLHTRISWKIRNARGKRQQSARILVSDQENMSTFLWDSGDKGDLSSLGSDIPIRLEPRTRYYVQIIVISDLNEIAKSKVTWFETGKMDEPWQASWISCQNQKRHPIFQREVQLRAEVASARLYICGLGLYEAYYGDEKLGDEYLTPFSNNYRQWLQVETIDVTEQLNHDDKLSVLMGNGWYKGRFGFTAHEDKGFYGDHWHLIAELHIRYRDGSEELIKTDEDWKLTFSNITFSNLYDGEHIDDTLALLPEEQVTLAQGPEGKLMDRMSPYLTVHEVLRPVEVIRTPKGELVIDLGQEVTGIFELDLKEDYGTKIHLQTGEILQEGNFYNDNLRTARSEFIYVSDGKKRTIRPHFTYYGYRYVKIEGLTNFQKEQFRALCIYSDVEMTGRMRTGHKLVNQLLSNVTWGLKDNFLDVPTDCPQRDERMGWTADTQVFTATALYLTDAYAFYAKYLFDMYTEQLRLDGMVPDVIPSAGIHSTSSVWGDAACIIPWTLYQFYGDRTILEDQYESMKAWVNWVRNYDGDDFRWRTAFSYGDWLALDAMEQDPQHAMGATNEGFISSIYYAASAEIVGKAAKILGKLEDAEEFLKLSEYQFDAVRKEYYSATGRCCIQTQTAMILTLKYHLSDNEKLIKETLWDLFTASDHQLRTGFTGTPLLGNVLTEHGFAELAFELLLYEGYPGWLNEVRLGATTVWERWNSLLSDGRVSGTDMNSMNHYSYGSIVEWMYRHVAGIAQLEGEVGFKKALIAPKIHWDLQELEAEYDSPAGLYRSVWKIVDLNHLYLSFDIPFGAEAYIELPYFEREKYSNKGNSLLQKEVDGRYFVASGHYEIQYVTDKQLTPRYTVDLPVLRLAKNPRAMQLMAGFMPHDNVPVEMRGKSFRDLLRKYQPDMSEEEMEKINEQLTLIFTKK